MLRPILATVAIFAPSTVLAQGLLPYTDAARVAAGAELYAENSASCHGADLQGQPNWKVRDADGYLPAPPQGSGVLGEPCLGPRGGRATRGVGTDDLQIAAELGRHTFQTAGVAHAHPR